jgi:hypothetical protein
MYQMAFHAKKDTSQILHDLLDYSKYLKTDNDPTLKQFQTPEGFYLNVTRVEQTDDEKKVSDGMEKFYKNYRSILEEKNE